MFKSKLTIISLFLISVMLFFNTAILAQDEISVFVDDVKLSFDVAPLLKNDRTMIPLRAIGEALNASVDWDEASRKITITKNNTKNELFVGQITAYKTTPNGTETITLDVAPLIADSRTLVPLRYISESFDMQVEWIEETKTVLLTSNKETGTKTDGKKTIDFSKDNTGVMFELHCFIRYSFEQEILPEYIFSDESVFEGYISDSDIVNLKKAIVTLWDSTAYSLIIQEMISSDTEYVIENEEQLLEILDKKMAEYSLNADQSFDVTLEKLDDQTTVIIIDLVELDELLISSYVGIAYNKESGIRYFTLEKSFNDSYMFCAVFESSRGSYYIVPNEKTAFLAAIKDAIEGGYPPAAILVR